jgi:hypothetical protein
MNTRGFGWISKRKDIFYDEPIDPWHVGAKLFGEEGPSSRRVAEAVAEDDGGGPLDGGC